jgi:hypothetical protein
MASDVVPNILDETLFRLEEVRGRIPALRHFVVEGACDLGVGYEQAD